MSKNQRLQSDFRYGAAGMPPVSRFRSGHMPLGINVNQVRDHIYILDSDMDSCSDSDGENYGARYSPEASPQDDKIPSGSTKAGASVNSRAANANRYNRNGVGFSAANDESSESASANSTPPRRETASYWRGGSRLGGLICTLITGLISSGLGYWYAVLAYDACVRLCLHSWARGCMEAPSFLENECALLRDSFGLSMKMQLRDKPLCISQRLSRERVLIKVV